MHNVAVEELAADASLEGESYVVLAREATVSPDVGSMERFETVFWTRKERRTLQARAGDFVVRMAQPAAHIALYLLEPESDDGLVRWNFFDELLPGATYPIARIPRPLELRTAATR